MDWQTPSQFVYSRLLINANDECGDRLAGVVVACEMMAEAVFMVNANVRSNVKYNEK